jgi:cyclophilin family peptidyl-prolyl cis-trans isomerase
MSSNASGKELAVLETNQGDIEIEFNREKAPITVENFVKYVKEGFFDGTVFHRVIPRFMIQGGGFTPDGSQKRTRQPIRLEARNGLKNNVGTIAMARTTDPDSATSQFFINLIDNNFLNASTGNPGYAVFGTVVSGMDVVKAIAMVKTVSRGLYSDWPKEDVVIKRAYMK